MTSADEASTNARKLKGAMLEHAGFAVERMPGLGYALNGFIAEAPARLRALVPGASAGTIEELRATTIFEAIEHCFGLTAAVYASADPDARVMIALDEHIDTLVVASIFGEAAGDSDGTAASLTRTPRTAVEGALVEAFARTLGDSLAAAFAPLANIALTFERLETIADPYALGRRDSEAAAARFSLRLGAEPCECLLLLPQAFLAPLRAEFAHDPSVKAPAADARWSRLMEFGVHQTRLPVTAILDEVPMSLKEVANFRVGETIPLQRNDLSAVRLECSGRGMFTCHLGQADGRYRLEVENPL